MRRDWKLAKATRLREMSAGGQRRLKLGLGQSIAPGPRSFEIAAGFSLGAVRAEQAATP